MTTLDEIGLRAGRAAIDIGAELASTIDVGAFHASAAPTAPSRRLSRRTWAMALGAVVVLAGLTVAVGALVVGRDNHRIDPAVPQDSAGDVPLPVDTVPAPTTTSPTAAPTTETSTPDDTDPTTTSAAAQAATLTRPVVDIAGCSRTWARDATLFDPLVAPFARSSSKPIALQVFGSAEDHLTAPFAISERFFADQRVTAETVTDQQINGLPAQFTFPPTAVGSIAWVLPDGSQGYLRSRNMTKEQMVQLATALIPRAIDAPVPGFDLAATAPAGISMLDQAYGPVERGAITMSACAAPNSTPIEVAVMDARILVEAAWVVDRPPSDPFAVRELGDGRALVVTGPYNDASGVTAAALLSVRQAGTDEWAEMQLYPRVWDLRTARAPSDDQIMNALDGVVFANADAIPASVIPLIVAELGDGTTGAQVRAVDTGYFEWVFTVATTGQPFIARQWAVAYDVAGSGGQLSVREVFSGFKCSGGGVVGESSACPVRADPSSTDPVAPTTADRPVLSGRSVRFKDCPTLAFGDLPAGWDDSIRPSSTPPESAVLRGQNGQIDIRSGSLLSGLPGSGRGASIDVDGYAGLADANRRIVYVNRSVCSYIALSFTGVDDAGIAEVLQSVTFDDAALTQVAEPLHVGGGPTMFGRGLFENVDSDEFALVVSDAYGPADSDTGWLPVPPSFGKTCTDAAEYRSIFWGDLRVVFERKALREQLTAWSVGAQTVGIVAPDDAHLPGRPLGLTSDEGLAVGAGVAVLDQFPMVGGPDNGNYFIAQAAVVAVSSKDGVITGFGTGRTDCS